MTNTQLKGARPEDPWLVVDGSPSEILDQLLEVFPDLANGGREAPGVWQLPSITAKAHALWSAQVAVGAGLGGAEVPTQQVQQSAPAQQAPSPAYQASVNPAPAAGGANVESKTWADGNTTTWQKNHPQAPQTMFGPAVLKRWTSQQGKAVAKWIDSRAKEIPSNYAAGIRHDPPDMFVGEFFRG